MQALLYVGIGFFFAGTIFLLFLTIQALRDQHFLIGILFLVPTGYAAWFFKLGFELFRFVSAEVIFDEKEFSIKLKTKTLRYKWSDVFEINNYSTAQVLQLRGAKSKTIFIVDHACPGYSEFAAIAYDKVKTR